MSTGHSSPSPPRSVGVVLTKLLSTCDSAIMYFRSLSLSPSLSPLLSPSLVPLSLPLSLSSSLLLSFTLPLSLTLSLSLPPSLSQEIIKQDMDERKPGEDVDSSQWKDTIIYERTEGEYFPGTRVSELVVRPGVRYHSI